MTITEFTELDPEAFHLVPEGATGFPHLIAKAAADDVAQVAFEDATKGLNWEDAHEILNKEIGQAFDEGLLKFVSAADRRKYAKQGVAMANGDFPIPDEGHLRSAVGHLGNYTGDKAAARAHIITRARALGLTRLLPEDWNVEKATEGVGDGLSQTHEVEKPPTPGASPDAGDGGAPPHVAAANQRPPESDGSGDTAPDKSIPKGEALTQTGELGKAEVEGGEDRAPDGDAAAARTRSEADGQSQAEKGPSYLTMSNGTADDGGTPNSTPGSPAWEHKDAALADCASHLISRANELIQMLGNRERAEKGSPFTAETEGAIRRSTQALIRVLDTQPSVKKEIDDMDRDELIKLLDERDEARRQAKKARKAAKAAKDTGTESTEAAKGADAPEATTVEKSVEERLSDAEALLTKMAEQPATMPFLNGQGVAAALRDPETRKTVFAELEGRIAQAEDRLTKGTDARAADDLRTARFQLAAAKMVAQENARERGELPRSSRYGPNSVELFKNTGNLPEDAKLNYV